MGLKHFINHPGGSVVTGGIPNPSYDLDFSSAVPSGVSVSRASTGYREKSDATLENIASNLGRIDFSAGTALGLLLEASAAANLVANPEDISGWSIGSSGTITANDAVAPNGSMVADTIRTASTSFQYYFKTNIATLATSTTYIYSAYVKGAGWFRAEIGHDSVNLARAWWDLSNSVAGSTAVLGTGWSASNAQIYSLGYGYKRVSFKFTTGTTAGSTNIELQPSGKADQFDSGDAGSPQTSGAATSVFGQSIVAGTALSSYNSGTRAAESATYTTITGANYDIFVEDTFGNEWRTATAVTTNSYSVTPRSGRDHVKRIRLWVAGVLSSTQRDIISAGGSTGGSGFPPSSFAYDFTTDSATGVTVSRADAANTFNSSGYLASVAANTARFMHFGTPVGSKGLVLESAITNLLTSPSSLNNAAWVKRDTADTTWTFGDQTGVDNVASSADTVTIGASPSTGGNRQALTFAQANTDYCIGFVLKKGSGFDWCVAEMTDDGPRAARTYVNLTTSSQGASQVIGDLAIKDRGLWPLGNGWRYVWLVVRTGGPGTTLYANFTPVTADSTYQATNSCSIYFDGAMVAASSKVAMYIATSHAAEAATVSVTSGTYDVLVTDETGSKSFLTLDSTGTMGLQSNANRLGVLRFEGWTQGALTSRQKQSLGLTVNPNLLASATDLSNAVWTLTNSATLTGTNQLNFAANANSSITQSVSGLLNQNYTLTIETTSSHGCRIKVSNSVTTVTSSDLTPVDGLVTFTFNPGSLTGSTTIEVLNTSGGTSGSLVLTTGKGVKLEAGNTYTGWADGIPGSGAGGGTGGGTVSGTLPPRVLGGYWWSFSGIRVAQIQSTYPKINLLLGFVAQNGSTAGSIAFGGYSALATDLQAWKAAGKLAILDIGGAGVRFGFGSATNRTNFLNSAIPIIRQFGFTGISFDCESEGADSAGVTNDTAWRDGLIIVARALKAEFGSSFINWFDAQPNKFRGTNTLYYQIATTLGTDCTAVAPQFYDVTEYLTASNITNSSIGIGAPIGHGFPSNKCLLTMSADPGQPTPSTYATAITTAFATWSDFRGAVLYHSNASNFAALYNAVAPIVIP